MLESSPKNGEKSQKFPVDPKTKLFINNQKLLGIMRLRTAVMPLLVLNIVFFILQWVLKDYGFTEALWLMKGDAFARPWTLLTSMFLHGGIGHILFNMYVLAMFGPLLEQRIGAKRFLFVYLMSGILASFVSSFIYDKALGASGAIMGMIGVIIILLPNLRVLFFLIIPMPLWIAGIVIAAIDFFGMFMPSGIANAAHLVGMGCGLGYGIYLKRIKRRFYKKFHSNRHMGNDEVNEYLKSGRI